MILQSNKIQNEWNKIIPHNLNRQLNDDGAGLNPERIHQKHNTCTIKRKDEGYVGRRMPEVNLPRRKKHEED